MRAAVLTEIPGSLEIADVQIDKPGPREVLVRTVASGLCHSDLHYMQGRYTCDLPAVLGHEAAGVVEAVGTGVTSVKPGDHVVACLSVFCGHCATASPVASLSARSRTGGGQTKSRHA